MSLMAQPWKHPQSGVYYFRREVPEPIRSVIGRREWKVSLRTKDLTQARLRFAAKSMECEETFSAARDQLDGKARLKVSDAPKLADRWAQSVVDSWESEPESVRDFLALSTAPTGAGEHESEERGYFPVSDFVDGDSPKLRAELVTGYISESLEARHLPKPSSDDPVWPVLVDCFFGRWFNLSQLAYNRDNGNWRSSLELTLIDKPLSMEQVSPKDSNEGPKLSEVFNKWADDKRQTDGINRSTTKTVAEFGTTITRFVELFGDLPVTQIARPLVHDFRTGLGKLPTKGSGLRSLTAPELIAKAEAEALPTASLGTIKKQLRALATVLSFAKKRLGAIQEEPVSASGLIGQLAKAARRANTTEEGEREYSWSELIRIFRGPIYTKGWKHARVDYGRAFYWLPLLMAYTGARREELCQLTVEDVRQDELTGIWYLSIRPGDDQSVKTISSHRKVPLHPDLIALGFLEYRNNVPADGRLFPKLRFHPGEGYGHNFGKLWAKYLREVVKLETKAHPSHGFRHSFKSLCREASISREAHDWITGHAPQNVGDTYGSNPLRRMCSELPQFPSIAREAGLLKD